MFKIFTDALTIFLLTYALVDILYHLLDFFLRPTDCEKRHRKMLLYCSSDDDIEPTVRCVARLTKNSRLDMLLQLKKETDDSKIIINNLRREFPHLQTVNLPDDVVSQVFEDVSSDNA